MRKGENILFFLGANNAVIWIVKQLLSHFGQPNWYFVINIDQSDLIKEQLLKVSADLDYSQKQINFIFIEPGKLDTDVKKAIQKKKIARIFWFKDEDNFTYDRSQYLSKYVQPLEQLFLLLDKLNPTLTVHYLSSVLINGLSTGTFLESNFNEGQGFRNYYEESLYIAEQKIRESSFLKKFLIYRKGFWVGSKEKSAREFPLDNWIPVSRLKGWPGFIPVPVLAKVQYFLPLTPVEYFCSGMISILENEKNIGQKIFHLTDPNPYTHQAILRMGSHKLKRNSFQFKVGNLWLPLLERLNWANTDRKMIPYLHSPGRVSADITAKMLKKYNIACADLSTYLDLFFDH